LGDLGEIVGLRGRAEARAAAGTKAADADGWVAAGLDGRPGFGVGVDPGHDNARRGEVEYRFDDIGLVLQHADEGGGVGAAAGDDVLQGVVEVEGGVFGVDPGEVVAGFGGEFADGGVGEGDGGADGDFAGGEVLADFFCVVDAGHGRVL